MATEVLLPQWGMNMQEGKVVRWLKREGDPVATGEHLAQIETAKINDELESPGEGVLRYIVVSEGETVGVHTLLAIIAAPGEEIARPTPPTGSGFGAEAAPTPAVAGQTAPAGARVQAAPRARQLAGQLGIDITTIKGSGPGGRILEEDVERARDAAATPAAVALPGIRGTIAERMVRSLQTMAQVTLSTEIDFTAAAELRKELLAAWRPHRLRPMDQDLIVAAVARALRAHPQLNATLDGRGLVQADEVNVGVALALPEGLVVGVVKDADKKPLLAVAQDIRALAERARDGKLAIDDVTGGTFTVSSLAQFDIDTFTPIVNPPEVAILGVGRVTEKPAAVSGALVVRPMLHLSLTFDHRAVDGAPAAQFLQTVTRQLADPRWMSA